MPLTDTFVKTAKPDPTKTAGSKFADGYGLFLLVKEEVAPVFLNSWLSEISSRKNGLTAGRIWRNL